MKERQVSLTTRLALELERLWDSSPKLKDQLVFGFTNNVKKSFTSVRTEAGLPDIRFHDLRHTAATRLVAAHLPLPEVGRVLGHTQANTTYRYVNANIETTRRAAAALDAFNSEGLEQLAAGGVVEPPELVLDARERIAYRMVLIQSLVGDSFVHPAEILWIYKLRSSVVHGSRIDVAGEFEYERMLDATRGTLKSYIDLIAKNDHLTEFLNNCERNSRRTQANERERVSVPPREENVSSGRARGNGTTRAKTDSRKKEQAALPFVASR